MSENSIQRGRGLMRRVSKKMLGGPLGVQNRAICSTLDLLHEAMGKESTSSGQGPEKTSGQPARRIQGDVYEPFGGDPMPLIDANEPISTRGITAARKMVREADLDAGGAWGRALVARKVVHGWEALTPKGAGLRNAENYLWMHKRMNDEGGSWSAAAKNSAIVPLWQGLRAWENYCGQELHSPTSLDAMLAAYAGIWDGLSDNHGSPTHRQFGFKNPFGAEGTHVVP